MVLMTFKLKLKKTFAVNIKDLLQESAAEVLGKRRKNNKPWVIDDILDLCDTRRDLMKTKE